VRDRRDLEVTVTDAAALEAYERAVEGFLEYRLAALPEAQAAVAADPGFALARCLLAALFLSMQSRRMRPKAQEQLALAEAERARLGPRERLHLDAARAWAADDMERALGLWQTILGAWPRDIVAVRLLHTAAFWCGDAELVRAAAASVLPEWDEAVPGFGHLQGMLAFGLEECGDYAAAEPLGRAAVARNPGDLWAVHAVAHVLEMQGRFAEGGRWLAHAPDHWDDRGPIKGHVWWHAALFALERDEPETVLALYDRAVRPGERCFYIELQNAASLLVRLELAGHAVGDRFERLAEQATGWVEDHVVPFTDLHAAIAFARTGRPEAEAQLASLERLTARGEGHAAAVAGPLLLPIVRAVLAFWRGEPARTVELLLPLRGATAPLGGSHAQRDVIEQLLLEAALRSGRFDLARLLAAERVALRPASRPSWRKYADALAGLGAPEAARAARARAAA
jgi:tetratricopeptide (TPR) repeat protein